MVSEGDRGAFMVIGMVLDVAVAGLTQAALLVRMQETISPLTKVLVVKVLPVTPMSFPLTCHWYCGAVPPFTDAAVKITGVPAQTNCADAEMLTAGGARGVTRMVTALETAGPGDAQGALLVRGQVTTSPPPSALLVKG